jgi:hypothetical protein
MTNVMIAPNVYITATVFVFFSINSPGVKSYSLDKKPAKNKNGNSNAAV